MQATELNDLLAISGLFSPAVYVVVVEFIERIFAQSEDKLGEQKDRAASSWALGLCMRTLVKRDPAEWRDRVDLERWTRTAVKHWGWSHEVLGGLYGLSQALYIPISPLTHIRY